MSLLRVYDCISLLTTDDSLHHWLVCFVGHRTPVKKKENWKKISRNQVNETFKILNNNSWSTEKTRGSDVICSKNIQNMGKVFKFEGIIDSSVEKLKDKLFNNVEESPEWNSTIENVKVIQKIDETASITHSFLKRYHAISSREFVHLRASVQMDNQSVLTCVSVSHPEVPETSNIIRAEHRLFTYILRPVPNEPHKTHFIWLMNINLKGWLPQRIVDQTLSMGMLDHVKDIRSSVKK